MSESWYYVHKGNRQGPVGMEKILSMMSNAELTSSDYVWKKGFDNWKKIKDIPEFNKPVESENDFPAAPEVPTTNYIEFSFTGFDPELKAIFIRIGNDRGVKSTDYGPFNLKQLKQLFKENRINGKTFLFTAGMKDWEIMADIPDYQQFFEELPPVIQELDRRSSTRKPFVARLFIQNNKKLYEGICRDISIGGMQVLLDGFVGNLDERISINVHPENSDYHFVASGMIVRLLEGNSGFSFRFSHLSDEAKRAIEKYLQDN